MRVLQVHNEYRTRGGEDVVLDFEAELLRDRGHEVERLSVSNRDLEGTSVRTGIETVWSQPSYRLAKGVISDFGPDIVHIHNTFPKLSPSVYWAAKDVPVVQTLHNYRLTCVNAELLRDGRPCEDCVGRRVSWPGVRHRCYRDSVAASSAIAAMQATHRLIGTYRNRVDAYITLTDFARRTMVRSGLPEEKVHVKPNFVSDPGPPDTNPAKRDGFLFVGRFMYAKGIDLLLEAWAGSGVGSPLTLVGDGPERESLQGISGRGTAGELIWPGWISPAEVQEANSRSRFQVISSRVYEGFPMVVVEALANGTPVIVPDHGPFPDIVEHGRTGLLFRAGDSGSLAEQLGIASRLPDARWREMSSAARDLYERTFTPDANYDMLMEIYDAARSRSGIRQRTG